MSAGHWEYSAVVYDATGGLAREEELDGPLADIVFDPWEIERCWFVGDEQVGNWEPVPEEAA